ncbi:MAG: fructose-6-phosphate aldolase [Parvularculaceae bacterium]
MKFFIDTADVADIKALLPTGLVDGVTTNPSLVARSGRDFREMIAEICALQPGPVSAEVTALETERMIAEGRSLARIAKNVVVKLPLTLNGITACKALTDEGINTNVTLCFSVNQALIAAKAGATYISPFIGRLDDIGQDGMDLIREIRCVFDNYGFGTQILAASIRSPQHMREAAIARADVATAPPSVIRLLANHPLTDKGLDAFLADWAKTGQKIL